MSGTKGTSGARSAPGTERALADLLWVVSDFLAGCVDSTDQLTAISAQIIQTLVSDELTARIN